ncbi:MAG TPA: DUF3386 family protein [Pirellulales bacterium]
MYRMLLAATLAIGLTPASASAHFLWVGLRGEPTDKGTVCVYFNEGPEAGSARLAKKIAPTKAWLRRPDGAPTPLDLRVVEQNETGQLEAAIDAARPYCVEARFDYGVFKHDDHPVLLNYYARHVEADAADQVASLATSDSLPLCVVPRRDGAGLTLDVLWQGKLATGCQVVVNGPDQDSQELTTDDKGRAKLAKAPAGDYAIRARKIDAKAGKLGEQEYEATHHYATLTCKLKDSAASLSADQTLSAARASRAVWDDFPGFTADLTLGTGEQRAAGKLTITEDGEIRLVGFDNIKTDRAKQLLQQLVQHRSGGGGPTQTVSYVDEATEHPLGRLMTFNGDKEMNSAYRVKENVVTEVNRAMGPMKFTISVLAVHLNSEGKYLPTTFNVSYWNRESGKLQASETHLNEWVRVGDFDLPTRFVLLRAEDGKREILDMEFRNHKLLNAEK